MHYLSRLLFISSALTLPFGFSVQAETLDEAIQKAVTKHPIIMAAKASEIASKEDVNQEKSSYYPTATANASFGRIYADNTTTRGLTVSRGAGYSWFGEGSGSLSQKLYDFSATRYGIDAAKARYQSAGANRDAQILSVGLQAAQAYLQLLRAQDLLKISQQNKKDIESYYNRIKTAFDNDGADESEVSRAQDFLSLSKNMVLQYQSDLQIAQAGYKEVIGDKPTDKLTQPSIDVSALPDTLDEAIGSALAKHPQISSSALEVEATTQDLQREKTSIYPELNAELSYLEKDQKDIIGGETSDGRALIRMNWDYSLGGAEKAAKRRAAALKQEAEFNLTALNRVIERDVEIAWHSLNLAREKKNNEADRLTAAKKTLATYTEQYEGSQRSILDLMTVKNT
jgi:adhesin transport system outer membrane protein